MDEGKGGDDDDLSVAGGKQPADAEAWLADAAPMARAGQEGSDGRGMMVHAPAPADMPDFEAAHRRKRTTFVPAPELTSKKTFLDADHCKKGRDPLKLLYIKTHKTGSSTLANIFNRLTVKYGKARLAARGPRAHTPCAAGRARSPCGWPASRYACSFPPPHPDLTPALPRDNLFYAWPHNDPSRVLSVVWKYEPEKRHTYDILSAAHVR